MCVHGCVHAEAHVPSECSGGGCHEVLAPHSLVGSAGLPTGKEGKGGGEGKEGKAPLTNTCV